MKKCAGAPCFLSAVGSGANGNLCRPWHLLPVKIVVLLRPSVPETVCLAMRKLHWSTATLTASSSARGEADDEGGGGGTLPCAGSDGNDDAYVRAIEVDSEFLHGLDNKTSDPDCKICLTARRRDTIHGRRL